MQTVKNTAKWLPKTSWLVWNTLLIKNRKLFHLVQGSVKGLDDYVQGKSQTSAKLVSKRLMITHFNTHWTKPETFWNSKTTNGILFPISTEFLKSKGDDFGQPNDVKSNPANGTFPFLNQSLQNHLLYLKRMTTTGIRKTFTWKEVKYTYYDGSDQDSLARGFSDGAYTKARLFPASSNFATVEQKYKDDIFTTPAGSGVAVLALTLIVNLYKHTAKNQMLKRLRLRKQFWTKISVRPSLLPWTVKTTQHKSMVKNLLNQLSVIPTQHQPLSK